MCCFSPCVCAAWGCDGFIYAMCIPPSGASQGGVTARGPQKTIANFGVISLGPFLRDQLWVHFFGANIKGYFSLFLLSAQCSVSLNPIKSTPFGELTTLQVWLKKKKVMNLQTPLLSPNPPINLAMLSRTWGLPVPGLC